MNTNTDDVFDLCSLMTFLDEGCLFFKMLRCIEAHDDSAPDLMNVLFPFCGLIVHDSVRFARKHFDSTLPLDSPAVNRLRNATKSLSAEGFKVSDYSSEANLVSAYLANSFKTHRGIFGDIKNALQPDTSIGYFNKMPVFTSYNMARYLANYSEQGVSSIFDENFLSTMGFDIGQAASISYSTIAALEVDVQALEPHQFQLVSVDCHYANLLKPMIERGYKDPAYFFFLSEALTQLNSITALRESCYFTDLLEIKMALASITSLEKSLSKLSRCIMADPHPHPKSITLSKTISDIIPREQRKLIRRTKRLRNAFVHYDFTKLLGADRCKERSAEEVLDLATQLSVKMSAEELLAWLGELRSEITGNINDLICLPTI